MPEPTRLPMQRWAPYVAILREAFAGRKVALTGGALGHANARWLKHVGATQVISLSTGEPPAEYPHVVLPASEATGARERFLHHQRRLADPSAATLEAFDAVDPHREAVIVGEHFYPDSTIAGRRLVAPLVPEWTVWDDKTRVAELWKAAGIATALERVVPAEPAALAAVGREFDQGDGTAWSADTSDWRHSGGAGVRWVHNEKTLDDAIAAMVGMAKRVRVMPMLKGMPCALYGFVTPDGVAALPPVEQFVFRQRPSGKFVWAGGSTLGLPRADIVEGLVEVVYRVGDALTTLCGYRGIFNIDGVLTPEGFLPTELNPRWGRNLNLVVTATSPPMPLRLLHIAAGEGIDGEWQPSTLEALIAGAVAQCPRLVCWVRVSSEVATPLEWTLEADRLITLHLDPRPTGSELWLEVPNPSSTPFGAVAASILNHATDTRELGLERLEVGF